MKLRSLFSAGCLFFLTTVLCAREPETIPLITGDGTQSITPQIIAAIGKLIRAWAQPDIPRPIWRLECYAYHAEPHDGEVFRVIACLSPQVSTARLIRGESLHCMNVTMSQTNWWFPESPVVDGWSLADRESHHYALVSPSKLPFTGDTRYFGQSFAIFGVPVADEDVIAVVDAVESVAQGNIYHIEGKTADTVSVVLRQGREEGYPPNLMVDLQKSASGWTVTKSGRCAYR